MTGQDSTPGCRYRPGPWVALAGPRSWLLVEVDPGGPAFARSWELIRDAADPADVVDALLSQGFRAVRAFALLHVDDGGGHLLVRGSARADLAAGAAPARLIHADGLTTWVEDRFDPLDHPVVRLAGPSLVDAAAVLPLVAGAVWADTVEVVLAPAICPERPSAPVIAAELETASEPDVLPEPEPVDAVTVPDVIDIEEGSVKFDHMFGATGIPGPDEAPPPDRTGLITAMPRWGESGAASVPVAGREAGAGATVLRSTLPAAGSAPVGPTVTAVFCPSGHVSPPEATVCRVCAVPLSEREQAVVPRPMLGVLRLSDGGDVPLDRGVLLGRAPTAGSTGGPDRPHVIRWGVHSGEVSRNHVEVTLDGWTVFVTDLDSSNGTLVTAPAGQSCSLQPMVPQAIEPGTVVSAADGVSFTYEVTP